MTDLSPAAQAVLDAYRSSHLSINNLAAALRAAVDQVVPTQEDPKAAPKYHSQMFFSGMVYAASELRAIAAELEGL
jgi:hypothetical protein